MKKDCIFQSDKVLFVESEIMTKTKAIFGGNTDQHSTAQINFRK